MTACREISYLDERARIKLVLRSNLKTNIASSVRIPGRLGTSLNLCIDLVVVGSREDAQIIGGRKSSGICSVRVPSGQSISCDGGLANIVATLGTDNPSLVADCGIEGRDGALEEVGEESSVD